jgi:hypothetical protein
VDAAPPTRPWCCVSTHGCTLQHCQQHALCCSGTQSPNQVPRRWQITLTTASGKSGQQMTLAMSRCVNVPHGIVDSMHCAIQACNCQIGYAVCADGRLHQQQQTARAGSEQRLPCLNAWLYLTALLTACNAPLGHGITKSGTWSVLMAENYDDNDKQQELATDNAAVVQR